MKHQCRNWNCGCWEYTPNGKRGDAVRCICTHFAELHTNTCECGEKEFLRFCKWDWLGVSILAAMFVAAIWAV